MGSGRIEALWLRPGARLPMRSIGEAVAVADVGIEGDHATGGKRQVTVLSLERWREACVALAEANPDAAADVDPAARRSNVLVSGVDLDVRRGAVLSLGPVRILVEGETRPCELLETERTLGLNAALRPNARAGVYGRVIEGGTLRVGAAARWED